MACRMQKRISLRRKLHILRALTNSKSVKRRSINKSSVLYIYKPGVLLERIKSECRNLIASRREYLNLLKYVQEPKEIIELREGSWFKSLNDVEGKLAVLVSNPPYIPSDDILGLQAEVGRHKPRLAFDARVDSMDALFHLCDGAASILKPVGFFAFETNGEKQRMLEQMITWNIGEVEASVI